MKLKGKKVSQLPQCPSWILVRCIFTTQIAFLRHFLLFCAFWVISCLFLRFLSHFLMWRPVFKAIFKVRLLILRLFLLFFTVFEPFLGIFTYFKPKCKVRLFFIWLKTTEDTEDSKKYIYIRGEYGRQLNVIEFWSIFNWGHNWDSWGHFKKLGQNWESNLRISLKN